jgi:hypothetical protein
MTIFEKAFKSKDYKPFWTLALNLLASRPENSVVRAGLCINELRLRAGNVPGDR